jgi:hypothetical protein
MRSSVTLHQTLSLHCLLFASRSLLLNRGIQKTRAWLGTQSHVAHVMSHDADGRLRSLEGRAQYCWYIDIDLPVTSS